MVEKGWPPGHENINLPENRWENGTKNTVFFKIYLFKHYTKLLLVYLGCNNWKDHSVKAT